MKGWETYLFVHTPNNHIYHIYTYTDHINTNPTPQLLLDEDLGVPYKFVFSLRSGLADFLAGFMSSSPSIPLPPPLPAG